MYAPSSVAQAAIPNPDQITQTLARIQPDAALQQYATMHKNDPYIMSLAVAEANRRKSLRAQPMQQQPTVVDQNIATMAPAPMPVPQQMPQQAMPPQQMAQQQPLPEQQGIGALPARNIENMADGGIAGYADDEGPGYADKGAVEDSSMDIFNKAIQMEGITDPAQVAFAKAVFDQESRNNVRSKTSHKGAVGGMQVMPGTFKDNADKGMRIDNPLDNARVGIRYAVKGFKAADGDPKLAAVHYYSGLGGMRTVAKGGDVPGPVNKETGKRDPSALEYAAQLATRLVPISEAQAEKRITPVGNVAQIPTGGASGRDGIADIVRRKDAVEQIPTGGVPGAGPTAAKPEERGFFGRVGDTLGLSPESQRNISNLSQAAGASMGAGFIPSYVPRVPGVLSQAKSGIAALGERAYEALYPSGRLTPAQIKAMQAETAAQRGAEAAQAPAKAAEAAQASGAMKEEAEVVAQAVRAQQAAEQAAAAAKLPSVAEEIQGASRIREATETGRMAQGAQTVQQAGQVAGLATVPDKIQAAPATPNANMTLPAQYAEYGRGRQFAQNAAIPPEVKKEAVEAAKEEIPKSERKGFGYEDLMMFGLQLLASKSPHFGQAVGEAGVGAIGAKMAREKGETERIKEGAMADYYKEHGAYLKSEAARKAEEDKPLAQARKEIAAVILKLQSSTMYQLAPPAEQQAMERSARRSIIAESYPELAGTLGGAGSPVNRTGWGLAQQQ